MRPATVARPRRGRDQADGAADPPVDADGRIFRRGGVVDESELYGRANFVKFANESFTLYGKGGFARDWNDEAWATSVGVGAELRLSKNVGVSADYSIRAWFSDREKDSLARALVSVSF